MEGSRECGGLSWDPATLLPDDATPAPAMLTELWRHSQRAAPKFSPPWVWVAPPWYGMAARKSGNGVSIPHPTLRTPRLGQQLRCSAH